MRKLIILFFAACSPSNGSSPTAPVGSPNAATMQAALTQNYARPALHALSAGNNFGREDIVNWTRTYDGAVLKVDAKSVWANGAWDNRFDRELTEPAAVKKDELISFEMAAQTAGLTDQLQNGLATARLVYLPKWSQAPEKTVVTADDVELVVGAWRLAIEIKNDEDDTTSEVDAYTNTLIAQGSNAFHSSVTAHGAYYPNVPLDITIAKCPPCLPGHVCSCAETFQDPVRVSTQVCQGGVVCTDVAGQGVVTNTGMPAWPTPPTYQSCTPSTPDINADIAFALRESWDYYEQNFARRGLIDAPLAEGWVPNDAIAYYSAASDAGVAMHPGTGYIEIDALPAWQNNIRLDVLGHEWTHAVYVWDAHPDISVNDLWGINGGDNEANSDFFGEMIEAYGKSLLGQQSGTDILPTDWVVNEDHPLRNMCNPSLTGGYNTWVPELDDPSNEIDPHLAGGVFDRFYCILAQGMPVYGSANNPERQSALSPNGFNGLTSTYVANLRYYMNKVLPARPNTLITAATIRTYFLLEQASVDYAYSPYYKDAQDAFAAVGIGAAADRALPTVTLGNTHIDAGNPFTAYPIANSNGTPITQVNFMLDGSYVAYAGPPYEYTPTVTGTHTLTLIAVDAHQNNSLPVTQTVVIDSAPQVGLTDVTPCTPTQDTWCAPYNGERVIRILAGDPDGVRTVQVSVDGTLVQTLFNLNFLREPQLYDADDTLTFTSNGTHVVSVTATDKLGAVSPPTSLTVNVDLAPPSVTEAVFTQDKTTYGKGYISFCANDPSFVEGWDFAVDGEAAPYTMTQAFNGCGQFTFNATPGQHQGVLHTYDGWDNSSYTDVDFNMLALSPVLNTPTVAADANDFGHVVLNAVYAAATPLDPIAQVSFAMCTTSGSCQWTVWEASSSTLDQTTHAVSFTNLTSGVTYYGKVVVLTVNGGNATKESVTFQLTQGSTQIYNEVEVNDFTGNVPPGGTTQVRGTYNGKIYGGFAGYWDEDLFNFHAPTGTFTIHSNFNCENVSFSIYSSDDGVNFDELVSGPVPANGNVTLSGDDYSWYQVGVNFTADALSWNSPTVAGCTNPQYSFDITSL